MIPTRLEVDDEYRPEMRDMAYFLAKTDPGTYSLDDLKKDGMTEWDGVRNPTAVNFIKTMKPGDRVIIYHSQGEFAVVGLAEVASDPRPDKNDATSWVADFVYLRHAKKPVTLKEIKSYISSTIGCSFARVAEHHVCAGGVLEVAAEAGVF